MKNRLIMFLGVAQVCVSLTHSAQSFACEETAVTSMRKETNGDVEITFVQSPREGEGGAPKTYVLKDDDGLATVTILHWLARVQ